MTARIHPNRESIFRRPAKKSDQRIVGVAATWSGILMRMLATILLVGAVSVRAGADDNAKPLFEGSTETSDPRGAVMCMWMIQVSIKALGEGCYGERDAAYLEAIGGSISEIEAFIMRNSTIDAEQLARGRARFRKQIADNISRDRSATCASGRNSIYPARDQMPTRHQIEAWTRKLLSVERPPAWNPCL